MKRRLVVIISIIGLLSVLLSGCKKVYPYDIADDGDGYVVTTYFTDAGYELRVGSELNEDGTPIHEETIYTCEGENLSKEIKKVLKEVPVAYFAAYSCDKWFERVDDVHKQKEILNEIDALKSDKPFTVKLVYFNLQKGSMRNKNIKSILMYECNLEEFDTFQGTHLSLTNCTGMDWNNLANFKSLEKIRFTVEGMDDAIRSGEIPKDFGVFAKAESLECVEFIVGTSLVGIKQFVFTITKNDTSQYEAIPEHIHIPFTLEDMKTFLVDDEKKVVIMLGYD